ncbi:sensor histidine kinase [Thermophilibacter provencensis]|uniref:Sensor-like histidine kinase SenX3 n=1 Tax=Thermophilibacter provencensis TaxID=1852386 RepID=A0ABT7V5A9_9ACTN|nr:HAMP domain-containing sensor histidine kinase [Thermophilibacter provencensis]MDM8271790.1 HAMP domain-containing sensor histidine kinase [Thermophilibacter provencensis]
MHDAFLEQLYRWLEPLVDWLLASSRMEWLASFTERFHMAEGIMLVAMLALGVGLGAVFVVACYATELGRQARFLARRERESNARLTCGSRLPGMVGMVDAVNAEIDAAGAERVRALRAADEFSRGLSALSHDVRTPLTGARGYLQLAREEVDPSRKDAQLAAVDARLAAMSGLLDELFSYARAADPDTPLELGPIALRPLLEQVLLGHYPEFEARGWEPVLELEDSSVEVTADREALTRIVENLVVNALRHGLGPLAVRVRSAGEKGGEKDGVVVEFSNPVADPSAIDADRLFERFYQADASRSTAGSGLGLSVAAKLATAQGMDLSACLDGANLVVTLVAKTV